MDTKFQKDYWFWPRIEDVESARKAAHHGMYASLVISGLTLLFLGLSTQGFNPLNIDAYVLIDVVIFLLIAWRIYVMSRAAAVFGLAFYILSQIMIISDIGFTMSVIPILLILAFVNSIRGTFEFHKLRSQEMQTEEAITKP